MSHATPLVATILLVEDEPLIRMATAAILEDEGYRVLEGRDAEEALAILRTDPDISIVVTDVQMPGKIDGLDLVRVIGQDYPHIQTLITSGRATVKEARHCGANKYLPKPYSASALQTAVLAICSRA